MSCFMGVTVILWKGLSLAKGRIGGKRVLPMSHRTERDDYITPQTVGLPLNFAKTWKEWLGPITIGLDFMKCECPRYFF